MRLKMKDSLSKIRRKDQIIEILRYTGKISKRELIEKLKVSPATLEKDIEELEKEGLVYKIWGGISLKDDLSVLPFEKREIINLQEKQSIAKKAVTLINSGESIGLGAGTTIYELAKQINPKSNIKIITYAVNTANLLISKGIEVIMPGGICKDGTYALAGDMTVDFLRNIHLDKCFLSVNGIDLEYGLSEVDIHEATVLSTMISVSSEVIALMDHTKIGRQKLASVCKLEDIDLIITDNKTPQAYIEEFRKKGIEVIIGE
jgi:DeoR/GlpR family transcriptional regulator of sugar metabolism